MLQIVSHRVDRMYFMTGNKLKLQSKYHVEDEDLQQLRDMQQARVGSRRLETLSRRRMDRMLLIVTQTHR